MLESNKYYHIYNRANGSDNLFVNEGNYHFFLEKVKLYLSSVLDLYCYCLMPNHFHFLVKIKSEKEIVETIKLKKGDKYLQGFENLKHGETYLKFQTLDKFMSYFISKQLSNLFSSYCQAFNKQQNRTGSLFQKGFKRKEVTSKLYLKELVLYIHCNAVHHKFVNHFEDWKYSSFHNLKTEGNSEIIKWFDDLDNFIACHLDKNEFNNIENSIIE
tara:strand:+ start:2744 stop:3388 length:645 start_codon:yes stop_codon:yes gene_type:complete